MIGGQCIVTLKRSRGHGVIGGQCIVTLKRSRGHGVIGGQCIVTLKGGRWTWCDWRTVYCYPEGGQVDMV